MARASDEVVRVLVLDPIISKAEFNRVRELIEAKRAKHWRARSEAPNRYIYNGFLTCGECGELIYTHTSKNDFYVCKSRHPRERRKRALLDLMPCNNRHMLRKKLEPKIDHVLTRVVGRRDFLERVVSAYNQSRQSRGSDIDQGALVAQIRGLREKRERILEAFFDGMINKQERDSRVERVEKEIVAYERLLRESSDGPEQPTALDVDLVLAIVEPFAEWSFLNRTDKRRLLSLLCPQSIATKSTTYSSISDPTRKVVTTAAT